MAFKLPKRIKNEGQVTPEFAFKVAKNYGFKGSLKELQEGLKEELEHKDITKGKTHCTAKIALAHLEEHPDYYKRLKEAMK